RNLGLVARDPRALHGGALANKRTCPARTSCGSEQGLTRSRGSVNIQWPLLHISLDPERRSARVAILPHLRAGRRNRSALALRESGQPASQRSRPSPDVGDERQLVVRDSPTRIPDSW